MATFLDGPVTVSVPATSANLGPGYDALGLALDLRDLVTAQVTDEVLEGTAEITVSGVGEGTVSLDADHLVYRSMRRAFEHMGCPVPGLRMRCENVIPHGRGLGSSSAAIVAGVCAARGLVAGGSLLMDDEAVFDLAAAIEGHPDNVAPALLGGFTIAYAEGGLFRATVVSVDPRVQVLAFVPPDPVETAVARALLPEASDHRPISVRLAIAAHPPARQHWARRRYQRLIGSRSDNVQLSL